MSSEKTKKRKKKPKRDLPKPYAQDRVMEKEPSLPEPAGYDELMKHDDRRKKKRVARDE